VRPNVLGNHFDVSESKGFKEQKKVLKSVEFIIGRTISERLTGDRL
jgi:hypothetical protein